MRIVCVGGGPAGLYCALLLKKFDSTLDLRVIERNPPHATFGWGVVFSDQTLSHLQLADPQSYEAIVRSFIHWDDIDVHFKGRTITSGGHGFSGIGRKRLLNILQNRCRELGVQLQFETEIESDDELRDSALVIAADGVNSKIRRRHALAFQPAVETRTCRYIWLGTHKLFKAFTFAFEQTEHGWFQAHAYRFDRDSSTFIVETPEEVWRKHGLHRCGERDSLRFCEKLFASYLDGEALMANADHLRGLPADQVAERLWIKFDRVVCERWVHHNGSSYVVLAGDAAHTAHFSVGSGTKLALEDAIVLARELREGNDTGGALQRYEQERRVEVLKIQNAARNSTEWFENVERYAGFEAEQFAYSLLTRSQRISHENLRLRDKRYVEGFERWFACAPPSATARNDALAPPQDPVCPTRAIPPMFTPFGLRGLRLANRVVVSPMAQYSCADGTPDDYYLVHLGSRAHGGAGLVFTEMTCVSADARISPGCAGMYRSEHQLAWKRIVDYVHARTPAKIALQLGHAGPKGSTQRGWEQMDEPLAEGNWPLIAPSPIAYGPQNQIPQAMTRDDMDRVKADFVRAAAWGEACGFDWLELHCAHGYLLSSFICPLTNQRSDEYGGTIENRCRYPVEIFRAMRAIWPEHKPMSVRISAHDWAPGGNTPEDAVVIAALFREAGCDLIDVSSGQTTRRAKPIYGRMYQTPFSDRIRNQVGIATMAVGAISEADHVNSIIAAGRADLCAIGRPHLADPYWTLHAAAELGYRPMPWPAQYLSGKEQLERNLARAATPREVRV